MALEVPVVDVAADIGELMVDAKAEAVLAAWEVDRSAEVLDAVAADRKSVLVGTRTEVIETSGHAPSVSHGRQYRLRPEPLDRRIR